MKDWLVKHCGWIGLIAMIGAIFFYVISFTGLSTGLGEVANLMANAWAFGVQLLELTGMLVAMAGIVSAMDAKGRQAFVLLQLSMGVVFVLDALAVFIGYGDIRNLPPDTFRAIIAGLTRVVIAIVAAIGPEGLTTIGMYLLWLAWLQSTDPKEFAKHLETNEEDITKGRSVGRGGLQGALTRAGRVPQTTLHPAPSLTPAYHRPFPRPISSDASPEPTYHSIGQREKE